MNLNAKLLLCSLCAIAVLIAIGIVGSLSAVNAEDTEMGANIASSGVIVYPQDSGQNNTTIGESPELALGETWAVLDLGEGNVRQVKIAVRTQGCINVVAYLAGSETERILVSEYGVLTFQCYKIEFNNDFSYEYDNQRIVFYDYSIID